MNSIKKYIFSFILSIIFLIGIFLRFKIYLFNRPMWLDECFIFENAYLKNFLGMFGVLLYKQSAPPLFLWVEKIFILVFGIKELVLRFFPFICSIFSIPIFYQFSKIFLKKNISIIIANILFAINVQLLYYAQELKQYSSDVLCFILLFIILNNQTIKDFNKNQIIKYSILTVIFPLLSIPSYFLIGAWILKELYTYKTKYLKKLILINIPAFITAIFYCTTAIIPQHKIFIDSYTYLWAPGFITMDMIGNFKLLINNINYFFTPCNHTIFILVFISIGLLLILKDFKYKENLLLIFSLLMIFLFSFLRIYPIYERVCLYTLPIILIFLSKNLEFLPSNRKFLSLIIVILMVLPFNNYFKKHSTEEILNLRFILDPYARVHHYPNSRELMKILVNNYNKETIIINSPSKPEYNYYKLYYDFHPFDEAFTPDIKIGPARFKKKLNKLTNLPQKNYIFFFTTDYTPTKYELHSLKNWKRKYHTLYEKDIYDSYLLYLIKD